MKILGIDTSCDDSSAAVFDTDRWSILSDIVHSHVKEMAVYGGVVPEIASREHLRGLPLAVYEAIERAHLTLGELDWICVTNRPGLIGSLLVGVSFAKALAYSLNKPFSTLNHIEGHLYSPLLSFTEVDSATSASTPPFPWIALVVSGGHTELFSVQGIGKFQWLGGTLDDAAGEAFDKVGKLLGFPYPAGPFLDRWVREKADASQREQFQFPRADTEPHHFSFSGLKTSVQTQVKELSKKSPITDSTRTALAASSQEAIIDALVERVETASRKLGISQIVVTGGVACNSRLRARLPRAHFPKPKHCTDNAAMMALLGGLYFKEGLLRADTWNVSASPTTDF